MPATSPADQRPTRLGPILSRVGIFCLFLVLFYALVHRPDGSAGWREGYLRALAAIVDFLLRLLGADAQLVADSIHHSSGFSMQIVRGCDGIEAMAILVVGVLVAPAPTPRKLAGILIGVAGLFVANLARLVSLYYVGVHARSAFETIHEQIWQPAIILVAVTIWGGWLRWARRQHPETAP